MEFCEQGCEGKILKKSFISFQANAGKMNTKSPEFSTIGKTKTVHVTQVGSHLRLSLSLERESGSSHT